MSEELKEWISKAEGDYFSALREYRARKQVNHDSTCFHAQQCVEKYLKAALVNLGIPFAKTHDLPELLKQIKQVAGTDAEMLSDHLFLLDPYSVSIRYPQEYEEEPDEAEVQEAVEAAYAVRAWVRSRLKLE